MTVIYKRQKIGDVIQSKILQRSQYGTRQNLQMRRCSKCYLLFETLRRYPQKICPLCRGEENKNYKKAVLQDSNNIFETYEQYEAHFIRRHHELSIIKANILKATNVTVKNTPICKRIQNNINYYHSKTM